MFFTFATSSADIDLKSGRTVKLPTIFALRMYIQSEMSASVNARFSSGFHDLTPFVYRG
jgi:hypothetical protein